MSKRFAPRFRSVGHRILALVAIAFVITAAAVGEFYAARETRVLRELSERDTERLLQSVIRALESVMVPGQAVLAQSFVQRLKGVPDVVDFRILRTDGSEAFLDNATVSEVNTRLGGEVFPRRAREQRTVVLAPSDDHLRLAMTPAKGNLVSYETRGAAGPRVMNYVYAVPAQPECAGCHGASKPYLGAFKLSVSMAAADDSVAATRRTIWIGIALALGLLMLLVGALIQRSVVRPIHSVREAMERAAAGDLWQQVPVPGRDEVGRMAQSFNAMIERLRAVYAGLHEEQDKLRTVIESTGEGVVVTDRAGKVVLVNEAAVRLLRKRRERIMDEGFRRLLDDPQIVSDLLSRQSEPPVPYKVGYRGRTLRVTAATIHSQEGERLGSAALFRDITPGVATAERGRLAESALGGR